MTHALIALANGSEEMEAVITIDILRRAKIQVTVASVEDSLHIVASRGVKLTADKFIAECVDKPWDIIVLPGGMPGAKTLGECDALMQLVAQQVASKKWVAAICAAPAVALGSREMLKGIRATCFPSFQPQLNQCGAIIENSAVVVDAPFVTSQGPGTAFEFALTIVELTVGMEVRKQVANAAVIPQP